MDSQHLHKPVIMGKFSAMINHSLSLTCDAPAPEFVTKYTWLKNGHIISNNMTYFKTNVDGDDGGEYVCEVKYTHELVISSDRTQVTVRGNGI